MYCVRFAILFLLCLPATGCQPIPEAVPHAEAIVMEHPDSAVRLLQGIPAPAKNLSRRNYARYALISTQARLITMRPRSPIAATNPKSPCHCC